MRENEPILIDDLLAHSDWVKQVAQRLVGQTPVADDLVQETWLAALKSPPRNKGNVRAWLERVTRNSAKAMRRSEMRRKNREQEVNPPGQVVSPQAIVVRESMRRELIDHLLQLDPIYRDVLILRYFEGLAVADLALKLGLELETARTRLRRATEQLRQCLDRSWGDRVTWCSALSIFIANEIPFSSGVVQAASAEGLALSSSSQTVIGAIVMGTAVKIAITVIVVIGVYFGWMFVIEDSEESSIGTETASAVTEQTSVEARRAKLPDGLKEKVVADRGVTDVTDGISKERDTPLVSENPTFVSGRVVDEFDRPVPGAMVVVGCKRQGLEFSPIMRESYRGVVRRLLDAKSAIGKPALGKAPICLESGPDGEYRTVLVAPQETVQIASYHPDFGVGLASGQPIQVGEELTVEIKLVGGVVLHGKVEKTDGTPLAGADLSFYGQEANGTASVVWDSESDAEGRYQSPPLSFPVVMVTCRKRGYLDPSWHKFQREDGRRFEANFTLKSAPTLAGKLIQSDGRQANVQDMARHAFGQNLGVSYFLKNRLQVYASHKKASSDPNFTSLGRCTGKADSKAATYEITLDSESLAFVSVFLGNTLVAEAALPADGSAPDLVLDAKKFPLPIRLFDVNLSVVDEVTAEPVTAYDYKIKLHVPDISRATKRIEAKVDNQDGKVSIKDVELDRYLIRIRSKGYAESWTTLEVGNEKGVVDQVVYLSKATGSIRGKVVDQSGKNLNGVRATLYLMNGIPAFGTKSVRRTNAEGRFEFENLAAGDYFVALKHDELALMGRVIKASKTPIMERFTLQPGVAVQVKPKGIHGPFSFVIYDGSKNTLLNTRVEGSQSFGSAWKFRLLPGPHTIEVYCPKFDSDPVDFQAEKGQILEVKMTPSK